MSIYQHEDGASVYCPDHNIVESEEVNGDGIYPHSMIGFHSITNQLSPKHAQSGDGNVLQACTQLSDNNRHQARLSVKWC